MAMADGNKKIVTKPLTGKVRYDYIKSNFFRVICVDGAHGGPRPSGRSSIHMALFSERNAIPKAEEFEVKDGRLGKQADKEVRAAIVREVEVDAIMSLDTARAIRDWLSQMIDILEAAAENSKKKG
jgi:hypothetical protein